MPIETHARPHPIAGTELVREWIPDGPTKALLVLVHGLAEHSGRYKDVGQQFAAAGIRVRSFDLIGAGGTGGPRWHVEDWAHLHDQIASHVEWAHGHDLPVVLMGHSLGGNLALGYCLTDRAKPDLLVLSAPALEGGEAWQKAVAPVAGRLAPKFSIPNGLKGEHLSRDPRVAEAYFADPLVVTKTSLGFGAQLFEAMESINENIERLDMPTLVFHGSDDEIVPHSCTEQMSELACVERKIYPGLRHETMNEPEGEQVVADVINWVEARI